MFACLIGLFYLTSLNIGCARLRCHFGDTKSGTMRDLPTRHRSMRAVFDHSWRLLTEEEQAVLLRLSVFQGGFRREAAEQVAGATLAVLSAENAHAQLQSVVADWRRIGDP